MANRWSIAVVLTLGAGALTACASGPGVPALWETTPPVTVQHSAPFQDPTLTESSGLATSRRYPGILWTHNDAGHPALLFATDTMGAMLGWWTVPGAASVDWEDLALGPCPTGTCLYIGDTGDNGERRTQATVYRVPEPDPRALGGATGQAESLVFTYPDQPRDVEALFVDDSSAVWLISKGRSDGIFVYRLPATAWQGGTVIAQRMDSLPIPHHLTAGHAVTGASISEDQGTVVVRTYRDLYFFSRGPTGHLIPAPRPNRCDILGLELQGEAVDWWNDSTLVLTSEGGAGARGVVRLVRCGGRVAGGPGGG